MRIAPPDLLRARVDRLRRALASQGVDVLVVTSLPNVAYLSGFFASAAAIIVASDALTLIGDGRYAQALATREAEYPALRSTEVPAGASYDEVVVTALDPFRGLRVGFEAAHLTVSRLRFLTKALTEQGWTIPLLETDRVVEQLRAQKDSWEVARVRDGAGKLSAVANYILSKDLTGRTESDVAAEIDSKLRWTGFDRPAFDTIVAAGPNSALPHGRPGWRQIEEGDLVLFDFGGVLDGYCTDMTRTTTAGSAGPRQRRVIEQVAEAQAAAFTVVRSGAEPEAVDRAARDQLERHGLAETFVHGTGHGLGLEIHEAPRVGRTRPGHAEPPLGAGMVLTLEPGVYIPGWGGVRIEDDVLVTESGAEWLTDVPRAR